MKEYFVIFQDEYNNLYYIGTYQELNDAIPEINKYLEPYETKIDELEEYPSTFTMCFDKEIETIDENYVFVRGFIFEKGDEI